MPLEDLTGRKFNNLTVVALDHYRRGGGGNFWRCQCECGRERVVKTGDLTGGRVKYCRPCGEEATKRHRDRLSRGELFL